MPRRAKGLTAAFVDKTTKVGRHADGGGLYVLVRSKDDKFWEAHFTLRGKRRSMGGGSATGRNAIRLADAREWNRQIQAIVREDRDPIAERQAAKAARAADEAAARANAITFRDVANMFFAAHEAVDAVSARLSWRRPACGRMKRPRRTGCGARQCTSHGFWLVLLSPSCCQPPSGCVGRHENCASVYNRRDYAEALRLCRPLADQGDAAAQSEGLGKALTRIAVQPQPSSSAENIQRSP
jgi:hypothetical protein